KSSNCPKPSTALSCCLGAGWWSAPLPGPAVSDGWCAMMSGFPLPLLGFIWWFSLVSCSIKGLPYRVPNRPWFGKDATEGDSYAFFHVIDSKPRPRERAISLQSHYPYPWVTGGHGGPGHHGSSAAHSVSYFAGTGRVAHRLCPR